MATTGEYKNDKKTNKLFLLSLWLLAGVVLITLGMFVYNMTLTSSIWSLGEEITQKETQIRTLKQNPQIQLYTLVQSNKGYLDKMRHLSNIPEILKKVRSLESQFRVQFWDISYSNWELSSSITVWWWTQKMVAEIAAKFIGHFRWDSQDDMFELGFINSVSGNSQLNFWVKLKMK